MSRFKMNLRCFHWCAAWLALIASSWANDREAVTALEEAGASVQRDLSKKSRPIVSVHFNLRQISAEGNRALKECEDVPAVDLLGSGDTELMPATLNALRGKRTLKRLSIAYAKVSDESAEILGTLRSLETLELNSQIEISPRGFSELMKLKQLKHLTISDRQVNDAIFDDLRGFQNLRTLSVRSMFVTDDGLASIARMDQLTTLKIFVTDRISQNGLRLLASLPLNELDVTYFQATVAGLKELRKSDCLQRLRLVDARKVNDETVPVFAEMTELKELEIVGAKFSKAGYKELKASLSKCKITLVDF